jgi:hypothetical protein
MEANMLYHAMMTEEEFEECRSAFQECVERNTQPSRSMMYLALDYLAHRAWLDNDVMEELWQLMHATGGRWSEFMMVNPHAVRQVRDYIELEVY